MSHRIHETGHRQWWDRLEPHDRQALIRHAYTPLPDHLAAVLLDCRTDVEFVVADHFCVDTRWYLSRDAAAFVADSTVHPHRI